MKKKKKKVKLTPKTVANQMLSHFDNIDWGFENDMGMVQIIVSARQLRAWCEAMDHPVPEGTPGGK